MKYRAILRTDRPIKGAQYFSPDRNAIATMADSWLDAHGLPGDAFEIYETEEHLVLTQPYKGSASVPVTALPTAEATPIPGPRLQHTFVPGSGIHCDKCGGVPKGHA